MKLRKIWISCLVILGATFTGPLCSALSTDAPIIYCHSAHVIDAGYEIRIFYDRGEYVGVQRSEAMVGPGPDIYYADLAVRRENEQDPGTCLLQITDATTDYPGLFDIRVSASGKGRIVRLEGQPVPANQNRFAKLNCIVSSTFLRAMNCKN